MKVKLTTKLWIAKECKDDAAEWCRKCKKCKKLLQKYEDFDFENEKVIRKYILHVWVFKMWKKVAIYS